MKGQITISRNSGGVITIEIIDDLSHVKFVEAELTPENFAEAITGMAHTECVLKVRGLDKVGMRRETKTELVPVPRPANSQDVEQALAPFEIDGWVGYRSDVTNFHRWTTNAAGEPCSRVTFTRHVPADRDNEQEHEHA